MMSAGWVQAFAMEMFLFYIVVGLPVKYPAELAGSWR